MTDTVIARDPKSIVVVAGDRGPRGPAGASSWDALSGKPTLATVATSGSASDLIAGTIPAARLPSIVQQLAALDFAANEGKILKVIGGKLVFADDQTGGASPPTDTPGVLDPALSAPTISADPTTPANGSSPKFFIDSDDTLDIALGYKVVVQWRDKDGNVLGTGESGALTAAPNNSDLTISGLASLPAGTRRYRFRYERTNGSSYSTWSPDLAVGPDDVAPVFSNPTKADIGATGATLGFTSTEAGQRYSVVVPSAKATPTKAQVKAGQRASGAAAPFVFTGTATAGVNTFSASGLTAETAYKVATVVEDALGNLSEVLVDTFTTAAAGTSVAKLIAGVGGDGSINRSKYVDVSEDGLSFSLNNDPGGQSWVRSLSPLPPKSHFEATITGIELFWTGVSDASLGPALYPVPGDGASAGFALAMIKRQRQAGELRPDCGSRCRHHLSRSRRYR